MYVYRVQLKIFTSVVAFCQCIFVTTSLRKVTGVKDHMLDDMLISDFTLEIVKGVISPIRCQAYCLQNMLCKSYFYKKSNGFCQTNTEIFQNTDNSQTSLGTKYYVLLAAEDPDNLVFSFKPNSHITIHYGLQLTWDVAKMTCWLYGAELASLETMPKFQFVANIIRNHPSLNIPDMLFHVGASDRVREGDWLWESGDFLSENAQVWCKAKGEPDNRGSFFGPYDTAAMVNSVECDLTLRDIGLLDTGYFVCEKELQ